MNLRPFVSAFGTDELLYLASGFMVIAFLFGLLSMNYMKTDSDQKSKPKTTIVKSKKKKDPFVAGIATIICLLYTSPSPRDLSTSRMPSSA